MKFEFYCKCSHCGNKDFDKMWIADNSLCNLNDGDKLDLCCPKCNEFFNIEISKDTDGLVKIFNLKEEK